MNNGNPFRKAAASRPGDEIPREELTPPLKTQTKKKVTIQTPPQSPEEIPRRLSAGRVSPPPPEAIDREDDDSDSTATADSDLEQASVNTRRNSGSLAPPTSIGASSAGAPYNPFARTLATEDASYGLHQRDEMGVETSTTAEDTQSQHGLGKQHLNVDAFKTILMTGSATPSLPASIPQQRFQDSSSSTETSSISRQSLFDRTQDLHPESPRTSFDQMESEDEDDGENSNLMSGTARLDGLAPPAPPKHRHGKALRPKGPQTVSFADFEEMIPNEPGADVSSSASNIGDVPRPAVLARSESDLNKPLPPPPLSSNAFGIPPLSVPESSQPPDQRDTPSIVTSENSPQQKKAPPPPPMSRRARSTSNPPQASVADEQLAAPIKAADTTPKAAAAAPPPPPPSRKSRPVSQMTALPTETQLNAPVQASQTNDSKSMPPPPPLRRNPSKAGSSVSRTPSSASRSSVPRSEALTPSNTGTPPAPPPRRGGGSKRESFDETRGSMSWALGNRPSAEFVRKGSAASIGSDRSIPLPNLQHVTEGNEAQENDSQSAASTAHRDILADMTAFQAEIDALRAKAEKGG